MTALIIVGVCALLLSWFLTPLFRDFFGFLEMVDQPDARRKLHVRPIPRVGGIAVAISYVIALLGMLIGTTFWRDVVVESGPSLFLIARLLPAVVLVFVTGLLDDFIGLTPWQKILGQAIAASMAYLAGVGFRSTGNPWIDLFLPALSVLWLVFCANAINLIDGLDGLASGVALLAALSILFAALIHHHPVLAMAAVPLIGGLLGFLCYNFNPATVFLGDCGSLTIGFLLGCFGLMWNREAAAGLGMFAPLMAMAVPAAEVGISIARRFLRQESIFQADRNHFHHRLLSLGLTQRKAALVMYAASALCAVLAVLQTIVRPQLSTVIIVLFLTTAYLGIRRLRYSEFGAMSRLLLGGEFRPVLRMKICLEDFRVALTAAAGRQECWQALREVSAAAGLASVSLRLGPAFFEYAELTPAPQLARTLIFPFADGGELIFVQDRSNPTSAMWMTQIVEELERKLAAPTFEVPRRAHAATAG